MTFLQNHTSVIQVTVEKRAVSYKVYFETFLDSSKFEDRRLHGKVLISVIIYEAVQNGLKKKLVIVWFALRNANCNLNMKGHH